MNIKEATQLLDDQFFPDANAHAELELKDFLSNSMSNLFMNYFKKEITDGEYLMEMTKLVDLHINMEDNADFIGFTYKHGKLL